MMKSYDDILEEHYPRAKREEKLEQLHKLNPDYVGLVVSYDNDVTIWNINKEKTLATLLYYTRKRMNINHIKSILCLIKDGDSDRYFMPSTVSRFSELHDRHKSKDNYLHLTLREENVFG